MPLYEYLCRDCEERFERYVQAFGAEVACPKCDGHSVEKLLSSFALAGAATAPRSGGGGCCGGGCGCAH